MGETEFCNHYRAMSEHKTCSKGVAYEDFKGLKFDERPCFEKRGVAPTGCEFAEFPTPEEREKRRQEIMQRFARIGTARAAIVANLGGPWKRGMESASGSIPCPVCESGTLSFSRSGYNGHIHAGCTSPGCVRWME